MRTWLLLALVACESKKPPEATPVASGSAPAVVAIADAAPPIDAPPIAPSCLPRGVDDIIDGPSVKFCVKERHPSTTRHCAAVDREGVATLLPPDTWPEQKHPPVEIIAPAGWTAKPIENDNQQLLEVEVCKDATCTKLPLASLGNDLDDSIATIAISPDAKTVAIDRGPDLMGKSRIEIHTISPPKLVREVKIAGDECTNILGYLGDTLLLQGIYDCVNFGGSRALATSDGKIRAKLKGTFSASDTYKHVGGTRWVFLAQDGAELWDIAAAKLVRKNPELELRFGVTDDHTLIALDNDGTIKRFDAELKLLGTSKLAFCERGN